MPKTIYDIAKLAGVSASTVSRVINNKDGIKEETRQRVQELLEAHCYIPDENARGLVTKVSKLIGILAGDLRNNHHTQLAYVVEQYLADKGYCTIMMNVGNDYQRVRRNLQVLKQRKVDGLIMIGSIFDNEKVEGAIKDYLSHIPVVICNGYLNLSNVYGILIDEEEGVRQCVNLLYEKGYHDIAFMGDLNSKSNQRKFEGYKKGIQDSRSNQPVYFIEGDATIEAGLQGAAKLIEKYPMIRGVVCAEDIVATGVMRYFNEQQMKVPNQIGVIGINNTVYCEMTYPTLTSLNNKMTETGQLAARILEEVIEGKSAPEKMMLFPSIIERDSTNKNKIMR